MKIFYGIQGTGNGHITRGRIMARELQAANIETTYLISGRAKDKFFDMEVFNGHQWREGLTFSFKNGKLNPIKTALSNNALQFLKDIRQLDLSGYELIISDYEPVTAWAARRQKRKTVGIGHQYAFNYKIPRAGHDPVAEVVMKNFAPVDLGLGLHWHHFNQPILPPIIEVSDPPQQPQKNKIVVYLPFENQDDMITLLAPLRSFEFFVYAPEPAQSTYEHIHCFPQSLHGFKKDLHNCAGIICNAGFELASEALYLGKKILVKPLLAQMEQTSNAAALVELNYGKTMQQVKTAEIEQWLHETKAVRVTYPNTARYLVQWIQDGMKPIDQAWYDQIWSEVKVLPVEQP